MAGGWHAACIDGKWRYESEKSRKRRIAMKKAKPPVKKAPKLNGKQVKGEKKSSLAMNAYLKFIK